MLVILLNGVLYMKNNIEQLNDIINNSNKITFFTGAGISVASGSTQWRSYGY